MRQQSFHTAMMKNGKQRFLRWHFLARRYIAQFIQTQMKIPAQRRGIHRQIAKRPASGEAQPGYHSLGQLRITDAVCIY
jgi:hypothetical protein